MNENLQKTENLISFVENKFQLVHSKSGGFFKKDLVTEVLISNIRCDYLDGKLKSSEETFLERGNKVLKEYINGKIFSSISLDKYGCLVDKSNCKYDHNGNMTIQEIHIRGSIYKYEYSNYYNDKRQLVKKEHTTKSLIDSDYTEELCYNKNNEITLVLRRDKKNQDIYKRNNFYNHFNQLYLMVIEEVENGRRKKLEHLYEYNTNNDLKISTLKKNDLSRITVYEYEYDNHSNWKEKREIVDGKLEYIYRRKLSYK